MNEEIEVKILNIDKEAIIRRLEELNCTLVKDEAQVNTIYDYPDLRLLAKKGYARIREVKNRSTGEQKVFMTVKIMLSQEKYKIMEENETRIEEAEAGHAILKSLGLIQRKILIKDRISYRYKSSLIEIDDVSQSEYPFPLLEIETNEEKELEEIVGLLGYAMTDTTSMTMTEIVEARRKDQETAT